MRVIDEPGGDVVHRIVSPGYLTQRPEIVHEHLIPPDPLRAMAATWDRAVVESRHIRFIRLRNVYVAGDGLAISGEGDVFASTVAQHTPAQVDAALARVEEARSTGTVVRYEGDFVLCKKPGKSNYGHWLIEMLPRAWFARREIGLANLRYVVPKNDGRLGEVILHSMLMAGFDEDRLVPLGDEVAFFSDLYLVDGLTQHGGYMSPLVFEPIDTMSRLVGSRKMPNVYVSRDIMGWRLFEREAAIAAALGENGYDVLHPERLPFWQQVASFKGARTVLGIAGAALTNICFARPGTRVVSFVPETMPDTFFWLIATHRRLGYTEIRCPQIGRSTGPSRWDSLLSIDAATLERAARLPELANAELS